MRFGFGALTMDEPTPGKSHRPAIIDNRVLISFSVAGLVGVAGFFIGINHEKVARFDNIQVEKRLTRIELRVDQIASRLGIPPDLRVHFNDHHP